MQKYTLYIGPLCAFFCLVLGAYLFKKWEHVKLRLKLKKRFTYARAKEQSAEDLLKKEGYTIDLSQKGFKLPMWVNGEALQYLVRPDAFASKEGKQYLVEVKTGLLAIDPKHSATRRQLLEYYYGFAVEGVLLVNAERGEIHTVQFRKKEIHPQAFLAPRSTFRVWMAFFLGVFVTLILTLFFLRGFYESNV